MEETKVAWESEVSAVEPRIAAPSLEVVAGRGPDPEPLAHGLRAVRELLDATDGVVFSLLPQGLAFHAASGADSAWLAQAVTEIGDDLEQRIMGPCAFAPSGWVRGELDGLALLESPLPEAIVLAERVHRGLAFGIAARPRCRALGAMQIRFAHAVFRDMTRLLRDHDLAPAARGASPRRWESFRFGGLIGASRQMRRLFHTIEKLAHSDVSVLILGESGTGKELVARAIHDTGRYAGQRFVAQNCAALPEALLESELFGHCRGAFTGANFDKRGLFEEASGGTFFLDEIADMPIALQIKLLRVLQEGEIRRVGETRTRSVSVRVIAATNKRLGEEVARGRFREDLYYRLHVVKLDLAPLRRRKEDVPLLARYFGDRICARLGRPPLEYAAEVHQRFLDYDWPGNVRELENEIMRLAALHGDEAMVQPYMLSERLRYGAASEFALERLDEMRNLNEAVEYLERAMIARCLERHNWNKSRAATELGISRQGLIKKVNRLQLVRPSPARGSVSAAARSEGEDERPSGAPEQGALPFEEP